MAGDSVRTFFAGAGALLLGAAALVVRSGGIHAGSIAMIGLGFALLSPAAAIRRDEMAAALRRVAPAALICFAAALGTYSVSANARIAHAQDIAALGVAFWAVAMLLASASFWYWLRAKDER